MLSLFKLLAFLPFLVFSYTPGVRFQMNEGAIEAFKNVYFPYFIRKISNTTYPNTIVSTSLFAYNCTDIKFSSFEIDLNQTLIALNPTSKTVDLVMKGLTFVLESKVQFWLFGKRSGNVTITLKNAELTIPIALGVSAGGQLEAVIQPIQGDLSSLTYKMKTNSYLYSLLQSLGSIWPLNQLSLRLIKNAFENIGNSFNPQLQKMVQNITYIDRIGLSDVLIDYHMLNLGIETDLIEIDLNGTCYEDDLFDIPLYPSVPQDFKSNDTFKIQYSSYFLNSYFWTLQTEGDLNFFIPSEKCPTGLPINLTTNGLSSYFANLPRVYGQNLPIDIHCTTFSPPTATINSQISVSALMYCDFLVRRSATTSSAAFRLQFSLNSALSGSMQQNETGIYLLPNFLTESTSFTNVRALNSNIGTISSTRAQSALNETIYSVSTWMNSKLQDQSIRLPIIDGITLEGPDLFVYKGTIELSASPKFDLIVKKIFESD